MAKVGKIDELFDIKAIEKQLDFTKKGLNDVIALIERTAEKSANVNLSFKGSGGSGAKGSDTKKATEEMNALQKETIRLMKEKETLDAKRILQESALTREIVNQKIAIQQKNKEQTLEAQATNKALGEYKNMIAKLELLRNKYRDLVVAEKTGTEEAKKMRSEIDKMDATIKKADADVGVFNKNVGNYPKIGERFTQSMNQVTNAFKKNITVINENNQSITIQQTITQRMSSLWSGLGGIMAGVGVAMVGVWGAVKIGEKIIASSDALSDKWTETITGLNWGMNEFLRTIATGDWSGFLANINNAIKVGKEYAKVIDDLAERQASLDVQQGKTRLLVYEDKKIMRDKTKSFQERADAGLRVLKNERKLADQTKQLAREELNNELMKAETETKLSKYTIQRYVEERNTNSARIKEADKYLELKRREQEVMNMDSRQVDKAEQLKRVRDEMAKISSDTQIYATQVVEKMGKATEGTIEKLGQVIVKVNDTELDFRDATLRTWSTYTGFLKKMDDAEDGSMEKALKVASEITKDESKAIEEAFRMRVEMGQASMTEMWNMEKLKIMKSDGFQKMKADEQKEYLLQKWSEWLNDQYAMTKEQADRINELMRSEKGSAFKGTTAGTIIPSKTKTIDPNAGITEDVDMSGTSMPDAGGLQDITDLESKLTWKSVEDFANASAEKVQIAGELFGQLTALTDMYYQMQFAKLDMEAEKEKQKYEDELKMAGGNVKKRNEIEQEYARKQKERDKERRKLEIQQAKFNKTYGIINAVINTFLGVTKALVDPGGILGIVIAGLNLAMGIASISMIASQPVPSYRKGRKGGKEELARISEGNKAEAVLLKDGTGYIQPKESIVYLPKDSSVITHEELLRMGGTATSTAKLPRWEGGMSLQFAELRNDVNGLHKGFKMLANVVENKTENHISITRQGMSHLQKHGETWNRYIGNEIRFD